MAQILIAWELGEAFGHLARVSRIAGCLLGRGHRVVCALKELPVGTGGGRVGGVPCVQAPLAGYGRPPGLGMPLNYADVLRCCGFAEPDDLAARLAGWRDLIGLSGADLVVGDHAPTALLAARLAGVAHLAVGNGFTIPPDVRPWPSIRPWERSSGARLHAAEGALDEVVETAERRIGCTRPVRIRELFGPQDVLDTFAELDHHGARGGANYAGPIFNLPDLPAARWRSAGRPRILAYLRPRVPAFAALLRALAACDAEVLCVAPGLPPAAAVRHSTASMRVYGEPLDLGPLLAGADLAVNYAGSGFVTQALLAGVPLLLSPRHVEQGLLARRVEALGAGRTIDAREGAGVLRAVVRDLLSQPCWRAAAQGFARRYRGFDTRFAVQATVDAIERQLARPSGTPAGFHPSSSEFSTPCMS